MSRTRGEYQLSFFTASQMQFLKQARTTSNRIGRRAGEMCLKQCLDGRVPRKAGGGVRIQPSIKETGTGLLD